MRPSTSAAKCSAWRRAKCASYDDDIGPGWKHLVAMREGGMLKLFVDGKLVAKSSSFDPADYDVSTDQPLRIGFGQTDYFAGRMADVRIYNRALKDARDPAACGASLPTADATSKSAQHRAAPRMRRESTSSRPKELQRCLAAALGWNVNISDEQCRVIR